MMQIKVQGFCHGDPGGFAVGPKRGPVQMEDARWRQQHLNSRRRVEYSLKNKDLCASSEPGISSTGQFIEQVLLYTLS